MHFLRTKRRSFIYTIGLWFYNNHKSYHICVKSIQFQKKILSARYGWKKRKYFYFVLVEKDWTERGACNRIFTQAFASSPLFIKHSWGYSSHLTSLLWWKESSIWSCEEYLKESNENIYELVDFAAHYNFFRWKYL